MQVSVRASQAVFLVLGFGVLAVSSLADGSGRDSLACYPFGYDRLHLTIRAVISIPFTRLIAGNSLTGLLSRLVYHSFVRSFTAQLLGTRTHKEDMFTAAGMHGHTWEQDHHAREPRCVSANPPPQIPYYLLRVGLLSYSGVNQVCSSKQHHCSEMLSVPRPGPCDLGFWGSV